MQDMVQREPSRKPDSGYPSYVSVTLAAITSATLSGTTSHKAFSANQRSIGTYATQREVADAIEADIEGARLRLACKFNKGFCSSTAGCS
jgi:hypothetical protein